MATAKQLRGVFAPILAEHPDLVLHRRWLFRPPITTAIIGLYIEPTSSPNGARMNLSVIPLSRFSPPTSHGFKRSFQVERVIGAPAPGGSTPGWMDLPPRIFQDMLAPEYGAELLRNFNAKVPAFLDAVRSFDDVVAWVLSLRGSFFDSAPVELIDGWIATMQGDFSTAAGQLESYLGRLDPPAPWWPSDLRKQEKDILAILRTGERTAIAAFLHAMEERTIAVDGLQRHWRRTPFPFERWGDGGAGIANPQVLIIELHRTQ